VLRLDDGREVRLAGVDAPAAEARALADRLVKGRRVALLQGGASADPYGRPLVQVRTLGERRWLQGALVEAGQARVRTTAESAALAPELLEREARARARKRGLWGDSAYRVRIPEEAAGGGFMIVEGRVLRAERRADSLFLDFEAGPEGFSVRIPRRRLADFEAAGLEGAALEGRLLRVRGVVRATRFGPTLLVDHPEQIERVRDRR